MLPRLRPLLSILAASTLATCALIGCGDGGHGTVRGDAGSDAASNSPDAASRGDAEPPDAAVDAPSGDAAVDAPSGDAAVDAPPEGSSTADAAPVPTDTPTSVTQSTDGDFLCGELTATVTIGKATDETDVTSYALYWGTDASTKLDPTPIAVLPKTGSDVTYQLTQTSFPAGATYLLAYSETDEGEGTVAVSTPIVDLGATEVDISAGRPASSGWHPFAVIDATNRKLLVVTMDDGSNPGYPKPALFRCNLDGTDCTYTDVSVGNLMSVESDPSAVIDAVNGKLLVVTATIFGKPALSRCNLDGTDCTYVDISAGQPNSSGFEPSTVIDEATGKLLVVTLDEANSDKLALFRCNVDGTNCSYTDISAGQPAESGYDPSAMIDTVNGKLLVVTGDQADHVNPGLFRCNLDGTGCTFADMSAGQPINSGTSPSAVIDAVNSKLLAVSADANDDDRAALFRCNLDGTGCTFIDFSAGQPAKSGWFASAAIDAKNGRLLVATVGDANSGHPMLSRCNLDGTGCTYVDFSGGAPFTIEYDLPRVLIDPVSGRSLVVATSSSIVPTLSISCGAL